MREWLNQLGPELETTKADKLLHLSSNTFLCADMIT